MDAYQVTGNEYVSLPTIREATGAIEGLTLLHMGAKGLLELRGDEKTPFLAPVVYVDATEAPLANLVWTREAYWVPGFTAALQDVLVEASYLCPVSERGFALCMRAKNRSQKHLRISLGVRGAWHKTLHEINETAELHGRRTQTASGWNDAFVMQEFAGLPLCAFAPIANENAVWTFADNAYQGISTITLAPQEETETVYYFGVGYEIVAAATSAKHLLRLGYDDCHTSTLEWLNRRTLSVDDEAVDRLMNTNLFFSFFYASGRTLDTEELCLMTSRSPRYYVSAAYWDRDSLLWSFPAIVLTDAAYAREILLYVFEKQIRNVGMHSRYIDGTLLEPGFELDELCAPILAVERYINQTGDGALLKEPCVARGLLRILSILESKRHPQIALYETFLQPTDDEVFYPYLTYDNVLVWRTLMLLADWLERPALAKRAEEVRAAILTHCVQDGQFIWSTDLGGRWDIYDEPPGSLQLLAFYGFCNQDDPIWQRTLSVIRSEKYQFSFAGQPIAEIGCLHAPHPWVLSICNSLLCGHKESALRHLSRTTMDNGIACESVNEVTGVCETGEAFATCAGFLSFALYEACR